MSRQFSVVVKVPVFNLTDEEADDLQRDPLWFLTEYDLWDEGAVEAVTEVEPRRLS